MRSIEPGTHKHDWFERYPQAVGVMGPGLLAALASGDGWRLPHESSYAVREMTIHIVKLCVGADSVEDLAEWQIGQIKRAKKEKRKIVAPVCGTRMWPKRVDDVLKGGSLYWVIKGVISVRQKIVAVDDVTDDHGERCGLYLDAHLYRTVPQPRRAFQGWRYLEVKDAPADLGEAQGGADLPEHLRRQLVELGAW